MVNTRTFIPPSNQTHDVRLRARLYSSLEGKPFQIHVPTRCVYPARQVGPRCALTEGMLDEPKIQPYVHDCVVHIHEGSQTHRLRVYFKRHKSLRKNKSFPFVQRRTVARGDFVVMRAGVYPSSVVNMRGRDSHISDWVIGRLVQKIRRAKYKNIPTRFDFVKPVSS